MIIDDEDDNDFDDDNCYNDFWWLWLWWECVVYLHLVYSYLKIRNTKNGDKKIHTHKWRILLKINREKKLKK